MRYTLHLLTLQQFQRASALICACETIRREALAAGDKRWGTAPFRIGLWVGQRTTPNSTEQADEAIKLVRGAAPKAGGFGVSGTPAQITNCPWCGTAIDGGRHIRVESVSMGRGRTFIYCGDPMGLCPFSEKQAAGEGLPILVVLIRVYVAYLAGAQYLYEKYGPAVDPWMTLVGYFNSMRELGGMRRLVDDDVRTRLQSTDQRGMARRRAPVLKELTSRMNSTDIPRFSTSWNDPSPLPRARRSRGRAIPRRPPGRAHPSTCCSPPAWSRWAWT
jgi:hypothetical protein